MVIKQKVSLPGTYEGLDPGEGKNLVLILLPFKHLNIQSISDPLPYLSYYYGQ